MFFFESDLNPWGDRAGPIQKLPGAEVGNGTGPATGGKGGRGTIAWSVGGRPATLRCVTHTAADWGLRGCEQGFSKGLPPPCWEVPRAGWENMLAGEKGTGWWGGEGPGCVGWGSRLTAGPAWDPKTGRKSPNPEGWDLSQSFEAKTPPKKSSKTPIFGHFFTPFAKSFGAENFCSAQLVQLIH